MSQQLINHSQDLKRLRDEGFEIEVRGGYLLIHHIPYLATQQQLRYGTLVTTLTLSSNLQTTRPDNHVIHFIGENPCSAEGAVITSIQHSNANNNLGQGIVVNRSFSNKPAGGYPNYYEKVKRYVDIISAPAKYLFPGESEKTFKVIADVANDTVFCYIDTNTSRANIDAIATKLAGQRIAIIGLGGTGAYILDLVAKCPVAEIHLFDADQFDQHNAFRSPGAASLEELGAQMRKVDYFQQLYSKMHKHLHAHGYHVKPDNLSELKAMTFVFVCVDKNAARKMITDYLAGIGVSFADVGLGVNVVDDKLTGAVRVTTGTAQKHDHLANRIFAEDVENNDYATNIQIAELNSLNAVLAVLKWKKLCGFFVDMEKEHHCSYSIGVSKIFNEDAAA